MQQLAQKLKQGLRRETEGNVPTAILGSLAQSAENIIYPFIDFRVAIHPILSAENPKVAMGIAAVLGLLFDQYQSTRIYRIFSQVDGDPDLYQWSIEKSQFTPEDWTVKGLDNNITVSGMLEGQTGAWQLHLSIHDLRSFGSTAEVITLAESSLVLIVNKLVEKIDDLAQRWEMRLDHERPAFKAPGPAIGASDLISLLEYAFKWENQIFLSLWGMKSDFTQIVNALTQQASTNVESEPFRAWLTGALIVRLIVNLQELAINDAESFMNAALDRFPSSIDVIIFAAIVRAFIYEDDTAYELLEARITEHPNEPMLRSVLAQLYLGNRNRVKDAFDTYQTAIDEEVVSKALYRGYAELLALLRHRMAVDTFVFIDPDDYEDNHLQYELIKAHQIVLDDDPNNVKVLSKHLSYLLDVDDEDQQIWEGFERLTSLDKTGQYVREFIDNMHFLPDISPAIPILQDACEQDPGRVDFHINLAAAYLADEDEANALRYLDLARKLTDDPVILADIDRLGLIVDDPDFEISITEMMDIVNAGNELSIENIGYLEEIIERVPSFAEGYILSAKTYIAWDEYASALDVLMDGHKHLPDDPEIARLLGEVLAHSEEYDLALEYLEKGLAKNPSYVPLLATMGLHLFEDGKDEEAKFYLSRAEQLAPRDAVFKIVQAKIAKLIIEDK